MSVAIHGDRVEFLNSGQLPEDMTADDLRKIHPSRPTNPDIAQIRFPEQPHRPLGPRDPGDHQHLPGTWASGAGMEGGREEREPHSQASRGGSAAARAISSRRARIDAGPVVNRHGRSLRGEDHDLTADDTRGRACARRFFGLPHGRPRGVASRPGSPSPTVPGTFCEAAWSGADPKKCNP
jgi:hypothetical protein